MKDFQLNTNNSDFQDRRKKVFDQLLVLENNRKNVTDLQPNRTRDSSTAKRGDTKQFKGKESIFKRPHNPAPKNYINKIPDFKKNPHKWTKYSLEDVEDVTEESNRKSAMDFLKELSQRTTLSVSEEKLTELPSKIVFKKRQAQIIQPMEEPDSDKPSFRQSKLVMPEYVIGKTRTENKKNIKTSNQTSGKGKQLKLDHLTFDDE
ncbi:hypothetical protein ABEB36_001711 [Hypothenemus hampei]|uniref:U5 small nuclear ribonucleoprotein TSSC4 n=1 Tax=Hypothenemus hampei TaxID=57062 RepID=A0ABD1FFG6_HYPHA